VGRQAERLLRAVESDSGFNGSLRSIAGRAVFLAGTNKKGGTNKKALVDEDHQSQSGLRRYQGCDSTSQLAELGIVEGSESAQGVDVWEMDGCTATNCGPVVVKIQPTGIGSCIKKQ